MQTVSTNTNNKVKECTKYNTDVSVRATLILL